jgi:hypothetical protein
MTQSAKNTSFAGSPSHYGLATVVSSEVAPVFGLFSSETVVPEHSTFLTTFKSQIHESISGFPTSDHQTSLISEAQPTTVGY